jgi:hypothetical protein
LPIVETIMADLHHTVKNLDPSEKWIDDVTLMYAGYLGYVIISRWGGEWRPEIEYPLKNGPGLRINGSDYFPLMPVRKRLFNGQKGSIVAYYADIKKRLAGDETDETRSDALRVTGLPPLSQNRKKRFSLNKGCCNFEELQKVELTNYPKVTTVDSSRPVPNPDWIILVEPHHDADFFFATDIRSIFSSEWRRKCGFAPDLTAFYGLLPGNCLWCQISEAKEEQYRKLEIRCNLLAIYNKKRFLDPRYLEIYLRIVQEKFRNFRFRVAVTSRSSCEDGAARMLGILNRQIKLEDQVVIMKQLGK